MEEKNNKVCIITGGTGGIGYHLSEGFFEAGYKVIALDISKHRELSEGIDFIRVDLKSEQEIKTAFKKAISKYGAVHILINNGAISSFKKSITEIS
ncbi:MAG: SDR family NAD(P)-dependent oxidoreductase, partial [Fusobacteriaceae bacterium]